MHWGLIPHWADDSSIGNRMINARGETLTELGLAPGKQPDNSAYYQNDQEYSRPDSGLEDISDHFTASQGHSRKNLRKNGSMTACPA
jgi:SOS response associated peptidase (SRAP)